MTDTQVSGEAATVEPTTTAPEAVVLSQTSPERDYEAEAQDMGWVPQEQFRGPKDRWKPAQQFVEDGENILPIVRAENKKLRTQLDTVEKDYASRFERLEKTSRIALETAKRQFDGKLAELTTQRAAAVKAGDVQTFNAIDKQITEHAKNAPEVADFVDPAKEDAAAVTQDWVTKNADWYEKDDDLTAYAVGISQDIARKNPKMTMAENLKQTEEKIRAKFPDKFGTTQTRNAHAPVDSGGAPKGPGRESLSAKLPPEAKAAGQRYVEQGLFKNLEEYAKDYHNG